MDHNIKIEDEIRKIIKENPKNYIKIIKSKGFMGRYQDRSYLIDYINQITQKMCDTNFKYSLKTKIYWILNNIDSWDNKLVCCKNDNIPIKNWNIKKISLGYKKCCCKECERIIASKINKENMLKKYGVENSFQIKNVINKLKQKQSQIQAKRYETKKRNNTINSSKQEDIVFYFLCQKFGKNNVIRQFISNDYPFSCDFFIKTQKLYIECNFGWTHGGHWYDKNNINDQKILNKWKNKNTQYFNNAIETWTIRDLKKKKALTENKLNFKIYWTIEEALQDISGRKIEYTRKGNVILMSIDEANKIFQKNGDIAFQKFKEYDFPYPKFNNKKALEELIKLREKNLFDKQSSFCIRTIFKSRYSCIHNNDKSPLSFWDYLKKTNNLNIWKNIYINRLRNDQSIDGNIFRNTGIPSAKIILSGINVSGLSKIPTYLKPHLAKRLIKTYLNEFNEVFCPFNGFGGIMLGTTIGCNKEYIGQDINEKSIFETNQLIQFIKDNFDKNIKAQVKVQDIFSDNIKTYQCLFACPPYLGKNGKNIEMWNFDNNMINIDKSLTCDQWIDECLKKYNCNKYLFIVDDKIKKYKENIVETLNNKSHFGINNEYVVLIFKK